MVSAKGMLYSTAHNAKRGAYFAINGLFIIENSQADFFSSLLVRWAKAISVFLKSIVVVMILFAKYSRLLLHVKAVLHVTTTCAGVLQK